MSEIEKVNLKKILPNSGPSVDEVKKYLEKYTDENIVIKCGGSVLIDPKLFNLFISDIIIMKKLGLTPIIVHGGGKRINNQLKKLNITSTFIKGLRVTDKDTIKVVEEVLIEFNNEIVNSLKDKSCDSKSPLPFELLSINKVLLSLSSANSSYPTFTCFSVAHVCLRISYVQNSVFVDTVFVMYSLLYFSLIKVFINKVYK